MSSEEEDLRYFKHKLLSALGVPTRYWYGSYIHESPTNCPAWTNDECRCALELCDTMSSGEDYASETREN